MAHQAKARTHRRPTGTPNVRSTNAPTKIRVTREDLERQLQGLAVLNPDTAGIDLGSGSHYVSVPEERDPLPVREFGCFTADLQALAQWLQQCQIRSVVMESTGVYWVPTYRILRDAGFEVHLVDAYHARNVPGRKTDVWDARWLRRLHTYGLLSSCFVPPADIEVIRTYWRHRSSLLDSCSQQIQLMHKALEQMNVQLHKTISDVAGETGMRIIRAILAGERDAQMLAKLAGPHIKASPQTLAKALTGDYRAEHLFALEQAVELYDFLHQQMRACDEKMRQHMARFEDKQDPAQPQPPGTPHKRSRNEPAFDLRAELHRITGVDLTAIEGISVQTAQTVFAELGADVSAFPTEKHFTSWLTLCPNHRITGGKVKSRRTRKSANRLAQAFRLAAGSLHHSQSALGACYRRLAGRIGPAKAITAIARKLACQVYRMLRYGTAYVQRGAQDYEARHRQRQLAYLTKQAKAMGFSLVAVTTGEITA